MENGSIVFYCHLQQVPEKVGTGGMIPVVQAQTTDYAVAGSFVLPIPGEKA
ncbi:MAG: hypothetical protein WCB46_03420 [Methanoregula sp.]